MNKTTTLLLFLFSHFSVSQFLSFSVSYSLDLILHSPSSSSRATVDAAPTTSFGSLTFSLFFFSGSFSILYLSICWNLNLDLPISYPFHDSSWSLEISFFKGQFSHLNSLTWFSPIVLARFFKRKIFFSHFFLF